MSGGVIAPAWIRTIGFGLSNRASKRALTLLLLFLPGLALAASPRLGLQTWTLRESSFEEVVQFAADHGIKDLQFMPEQIGLGAKPEVWAAKKRTLDDLGLRAYSIGVTNTHLDQAKNREIFEFAKAMALELIVIEPPDFRILDLIEALVKEYDIRVAIHNHGINTLYGNPLVIRNLIMHRDKRIGVCLDVGWLATGRFDVAEVYREYEGRVFDIHFKDKVVTGSLDGDRATPAMIGAGSVDFRSLFDALRHAEYGGVLAIETDGDWPDRSAFVKRGQKLFQANFPR
ncbi:MAG: sugar phosphate isomerase/epimerase family protein [Burkholderiaceae bacterium]